MLLLFLTCPISPLCLCRMARACLNLMAAMVTQGSEAARDVCSHFDLHKKTLYTLVTKRDSKVRSPEHLASPVFPFHLEPRWLTCPPSSSLGPHIDVVGDHCVEKRALAALEPGRKEGLTSGQQWWPGHGQA